MNFFKSKKRHSNDQSMKSQAEKADWASTGSSKENKSNDNNCSEGSVKGSARKPETAKKTSCLEEFLENLDISELKKKATSGEVSADAALEEMMRFGGREEWIDVFQQKMKTNSQGYVEGLTQLRKEASEDKTMKKLKKLYKKEGKTALEVEIEDEFDSIPKDMRKKLFKLQAPQTARQLLSRGKKDEALQEFKRQYVKDKVCHVISLMDDKEFDMMKMITTGEGLRIPPQAILKNRNLDAKASVGKTTSGRKQKLAQDSELVEVEAELREALRKNDNEKVNEVMVKLKNLKNVDAYGNNMDV